MWEELGSVAQIQNWKSLWQECTDWALPRKNNILSVTIDGAGKPIQRMIDSCIKANYDFATGFFSRMFPSGSIWGKFKHPDPEINAIPDVAYYFEKVSREIHAILQESNFTQEMQESLIDIGCLGTNCIYVEEDFDDIVTFRSFTIGNVRIGLDSKGRVDTVGREFELNSRQMLQEFGEEALTKANLASINAEVNMQKGKNYKIYHLVFPRKDYNAMMTDVKNRKFASVYVCESNKQVLKEGGYTHLPYFIGRFATGNNEVYGRSPMMNILGTTRRSNVIKRSLIAVAELNASPQWLVKDDDSVRGLSNRANAIIKYRTEKPQRLDQNGNPALANEIYEAHDQEIREAFFVDKFRPLDDYRNMTLGEAQMRHQTDLLALTPFASRYYDEVVTPMLTYVYKIAQRSGRLPVPPQELVDSPNFKIEYIGQLSLAAMSFETRGAFATISQFAELANVIPGVAEVFDNVDLDDVFRKSWYNNNASMSSLRPPGDDEAEEQTVTDIRTERAQAAEEAAAKQALPDAAQAFSMTSKAPEEGSPAEKLMSMVG